MKTLYFSSEGHSSIGGMDVFMSTRLSEDSWTEWSEPINLGKEINSVNDDCWYKISTDGKTAYFSKGMSTNGDIYTLNLPERLRPAPVATISGKLKDADGKAVVTTIRWENLETHEQVGLSHTDPQDGSYFIVLPTGKNYGYYIDDNAYFPVAENIDLRNTNEIVQIDNNNVMVASLDQMIEKGIPMPLNNLFFNTAEYILLPPSVTELQRVVEILKSRPLKVEISGHTDNVGTDADNQVLSENRAEAVRSYLVENGISNDLLTTKGYGESRPVATNNTEYGRHKNRRVEIKFIK
ncbi:MAG: OmpA family protein [Paludibacteraceae bacterium]|nr:OmpA family protein [Paludibacteraceae bacterium]